MYFQYFNISLMEENKEEPKSPLDEGERGEWKKLA